MYNITLWKHIFKCVMFVKGKIMETTSNFTLSDEELAELQSLFQRVKDSASELRSGSVE